MGQFCLTFTPANLASATTSEDVVTLPSDWGGKLVRAEAFVDTANCTGAGAALSIVVQTGADGAESTKLTLTCHATNDQQEVAATIPATTTANISPGSRLRVAATAAGASTAAATGMRVRLFFDRPINPS